MPEGVAAFFISVAIRVRHDSSKEKGRTPESGARPGYRLESAGGYSVPGSVQPWYHRSVPFGFTAPR
jgi:hypothetical protein